LPLRSLSLAQLGAGLANDIRPRKATGGDDHHRGVGKSQTFSGYRPGKVHLVPNDQVWSPLVGNGEQGRDTHGGDAPGKGLTDGLLLGHSIDGCQRPTFPRGEQGRAAARVGTPGQPSPSTVPTIASWQA
jgi:hypothetical protein